VFWNALPTITKCIRELIHLKPVHQMPQSILKAISAVSLGLFLAACGGGGGDTLSARSLGDLQFAPPKTCDYFCASVVSAPPEGATVSGFVRLDLIAANIKNAELLPETGDTPKYGKFNLYAKSETFSNAWMDLDTTKLPNGPFRARIVVWDAPAGQPGRQQVVLTRIWNINNALTPGSLSVSSVGALADGSVASGTTRLVVQGTGLANVELLPATGYTPKLGVFNVSSDRTQAWLDVDTKTQVDGMKNVRISAFSDTAGQSGATEVVAMPARQWNFQNGLGSFSANAVVAPVNGSVIGGMLHVEIEGANLENVEVLPATGYSPKYGTNIVISADKTKSSVYVDTSTLPKGLTDLRVSVFNKPAGDPTATEIVVMPARQFDIR
jgi:hypothetical protein